MSPRVQQSFDAWRAWRAAPRSDAAARARAFAASVAAELALEEAELVELSAAKHAERGRSGFARCAYCEARAVGGSPILGVFACERHARDARKTLTLFVRASASWSARAQARRLAGG